MWKIKVLKTAIVECSWKLFAFNLISKQKKNCHGGHMYLPKYYDLGM